MLDDQDIDDQDREVLNDRILGIINIFQHIVQSNNQQAILPSKQIRALQDLGKKKMSIEMTATGRGTAGLDKKMAQGKDGAPKRGNTSAHGAK